MGRFFLIAGLFATTAWASEPVSVSHAYLPGRYDDNDWVEIVIEGKLPDACSRLVYAEASVDQATGKIELDTRIERSDGGCAEPSPSLTFARTLGLGTLPSRIYSVTQGSRSLGSLPIAHTDSPRRDTSSYAPVSSVALEGASGSAWTALLSGTFEHTCIEFKRSIITVEHDVIILEPIIRLGEFGCEDVKVPFDVRAALPQSLPAGRYLLHVRSNGGKSLNLLFDR